MTRRRRRLTLVPVGLAVLMTMAPTAWAHGGEVSVIVEAIASTDAPGTVDYALRLDFEDGDPVSAAEVSVTTDPGESVSTGEADETIPGIYIVRVMFPAAGSWRVNFEFDHPDGSGSVEFTQVVGDEGAGTPLVMVDTGSPERVGSEVTGDSSILAGTEPAASSGSSLPVVVEAYIADQVAPLQIEYAVAVDGADDGRASVTLSATSDDGATLPPVALRLDGDVFRAMVEYPSGGIWAVTLLLDISDRESETIEFGENLPWPHFTTEAGTPKVKVDSLDPSREGSLVRGDDSVYLRAPTPGDAAAPSTSPTVTTTASTVRSTPIEEVVVEVTTPREELTVDIALRLSHLVAIGLWLVPIGVSLFVTVETRWVIVSLVGAGLALATGLALALWGAPVTFPGIFRWQEMLIRLYGTPYLISFGIKMVAVLIGLIGTAAWARRRTARPTILILGSFTVALVAVTAMSQFHTFSHL